MIQQLGNQLLAVLALLGAGLEGVALEMPDGVFRFREGLMRKNRVQHVLE